MSTNDSQLDHYRYLEDQRPQNELDNWICTEGIYENGKIVCKVPKLENYESSKESENLQYSVDVALNGQQFTGRPVAFRYYDIKFTKIEPEFGLHEGGTNLHLIGNGLYDS